MAVCPICALEDPRQAVGVQFHGRCHAETFAYYSRRADFVSMMLNSTKCADIGRSNPFTLALDNDVASVFCEEIPSGGSAVDGDTEN